MTWLLHMSDPHLGDVSPGQKLDDDKVELDQPDLETTQKVFKRTLRKLDRFVGEHGKPSVVVVSGDLTYQTSGTGFDAFVSLLGEHEDLLPDDRSRIIVVPGNHDVDWNEPAGTAARYAGFLQATRREGCATPLLDGIDFDTDDETGTLTDDTKTLPHLVRDDDLLVIPINSSNWCGTITQTRNAWSTDQWTKVFAALEPDDATAALAQVDKLRRHDIARVSKPQIEAIGRLFET